MLFNKYYLSALSAFVLWGFFSLVLKPLHQYASLDILFYRVFFSVLLLLSVNLLFRKQQISRDYAKLKLMDRQERLRSVGIILAGGILLILNWFLFIYAMNHVSLQSASFAYLLCPILTTILAYFILKERLSRGQWFAVLLSLISCAILSFGKLSDLLFSVFIALSFAIYLILQRVAHHFDRFLVLTVQMVLAAIVILPFFPSFSQSVPDDPMFYYLLTLIVVFMTVLPLYLNLYALKGVSSSTVGILMYINPLINFLLAVFWFREEVGGVQVVSYSLILLSVILFNLYKPRLPDPPPTGS